MKQPIRIAIDGPAAAGKSTVAKIIAKELSLVYIDTGAMYRCVTYKALQNNIDLHDEQALVNMLETTTIGLAVGEKGQIVLLDQVDVSDEVRTSEVTNNVSVVAAHKMVREILVDRQKQLAEKGGIVMDGRDIGTHVIPDAEVKIFMVASVDERAERRHKENIERGFDSSLEQLKEEIAARDKFDSERKASPLKQAEDAVLVDTTGLGLEEVVSKILNIIEQLVK